MWFEKGSEGVMRVLLISPKGEFLCRSPQFADFMNTSREMRTILHFWNGIGVALPTLAALVPPGWEVTIIDENLEPIDFEIPCDLVGITAMTQQVERAYAVAAEFRKRGRHVVLGGIHATVMPDEAAKHVDSVIVGEAENSWPQLLRDLEAGSPRTIYNQKDFPPVDMTKIPVPRYELLSRYRYPVVWIETSRGCPYDCEFCTASKVYGRKRKHKSVSQVVDEVQHVRSIWKHAQIGFADDNMFISRQFTRELLPALSHLNFPWYGQTDISIADEPSLLRQLHESGCRILFIGFESASVKSMRSFRGNKLKRRMFSEYAVGIEAIQRQGIGIYGSFILGLDKDDKNIIEQTINFIGDTHLMGAQITLLTPFPGSKLRKRLEAEGRILDNDWRWYTGWNVVITHPILSKKDLENGLLSIYHAIYSRASHLSRAGYFRGIISDLIQSSA